MPSAAHPPVPDTFPVVDGELVVGGQPLSRLAARAGGTPFYVVEREAVRRRIASLRALLPPSVAVTYAMKANPLPALVQFVAPLLDGADVASAGELQVALNAGVDPASISFAGPGKTEAELVQAVAAGVLVSVEGERELPLLAAAAARLGLPARVALRVNPDFELKGSGMRMGGGARPFGIDADRVPALWAEARRLGLVVEGLHHYVGSQSLRADAVCAALAASVESSIALAAAAPDRGALRLLNLGGGFGIPYFPGEQPLDLARVGQALHALAARAQAALPGVRLVLELGRWLVGEAGLYVCRVVERKVSRGQVFLVVDGGMHHHLAASGNLGQVVRRNYPLTVSRRGHDGRLEAASVTGPLCTPLDLLADRVVLPAAVEGDLVVVYQSGAYGASASPQRFLGHPPPAELLV